MPLSSSCCAACGPGCACDPPCVPMHQAWPNPPTPIRIRECRILPIATPHTVFPIEVVSESEPVICCCGDDPAQMGYRSFRQSIVYTLGGSQNPPRPLRWIYEITETYDPATGVTTIKYESWDYGYYSSQNPPIHQVNFQTHSAPVCVNSAFMGLCPSIVVGGCGAVSAGYVGISGEGYASCTVKTADYKYRTIICPYPGLESVEVHYKERTFLEPATDECQPHPTCGSACCLPGGRCRDGLSASQCKALGGIYKPNQTCFGAGCDDNENKGACCSWLNGSCVMSFAHECEYPNSFLGLGVQCDPSNPCPPPRGRCCYASGAQTICAYITEAECSALNGQWARQLDCSTPCNPPVGGACCKADGTCEQVSSPEACAALNGIFYSGGNCGAVQCTGSCCTPDPLGGPPICSVVTPQQCVAGGGTFVGSLGCDPNPCDQGGACCCQTSHGWDCTQTSQSACSGGPCVFFAGQSCSPSPCGGTTEAPRLPLEDFLLHAPSRYGYARMPSGIIAPKRLASGCGSCGSKPTGGLLI